MIWKNQLQKRPEAIINLFNFDSNVQCVFFLPHHSAAALIFHKVKYYALNACSVYSAWQPCKYLLNHSREYLNIDDQIA